MSKSSSQKNNPAEKTKPKSSFKRFDIKAMVALQLVAAIVLLIIINYFSSRYAQRIDLTQHSDFTLSELSTKYLSSDAFSKRKDPVKIIVAFRKSSPHYARISALIENYESRANGKIEVEYVDPIRDAERARQVADYYEIHFSEDLIIVDADQASTDTATASENESATYRRVVTLDDLVVKKTDRNNHPSVAFS